MFSAFFNRYLYVFDYFGFAVSMCYDGNSMVVGAKFDVSPGSSAGSVEVYEYSSGSWTKMGSTINGEAASDQFGWSVSMNGAGTRIVVGANQNDGNGSNSGHVRIYDWNGTAWTQVGADIDGENINNESGRAVSMNNDGNIIALPGLLNSVQTISFALNKTNSPPSYCLLYTSPSPRD